MSKSIKLGVIYGVIVVLVALVVLGFCIPKSYNPEIDAPYTISITSSSGQEQYDGGDLKNNKERYNVLYDLYQNSTKESLVASLFSGNLFYKNRIELLSSTNLTFSGYRMMFKYSEEQTIKLNGKEFAHSTDSSTILKYTRLYFDVVQTNGFAKVTMYYEVPTVVNETNQTVYYKRLVVANFDKLYQAITDVQ